MIHSWKGPIIPESYFEIGVYDIKVEDDFKMLWRTAYVLGANGVFTVKSGYGKKGIDTMGVIQAVPLRHYRAFSSLYEYLSFGAQLVGIDDAGENLHDFVHPKMAIYLLGTEDARLPEAVRIKCHKIVSVESLHDYRLSATVSGSIVMWDRLIKSSVASD